MDLSYVLQTADYSFKFNDDAMNSQSCKSAGEQSYHLQQQQQQQQQYRQECGSHRFYLRDGEPQPRGSLVDQSSKSPSSLPTSLPGDTSKPFSCPKCGRCFTVKGNMTRHFRYECGQEPRFRCPYCDFRSKQTSNVMSHVRNRHVGERVYVVHLKY